MLTELTDFVGDSYRLTFCSTTMHEKSYKLLLYWFHIWFCPQRRLSKLSEIRFLHCPNLLPYICCAGLARTELRSSFKKPHRTVSLTLCPYCHTSEVIMIWKEPDAHWTLSQNTQHSTCRGSCIHPDVSWNPAHCAPPPTCATRGRDPWSTMSLSSATMVGCSPTSKCGTQTKLGIIVRHQFH